MAFCRNRSQIILVLFIQIVTTQGSQFNEVFVSQARGVDRPSCGTRLQPCKSISGGVWRADNNAHIYIDGRGTQTSPYPCQSSSLKLQGIYANKSLSLIGVQSPVNVKCRDGLGIRLDHSNLNYNGTTINLTNIWFLGSPINAHDVNLQINTCTFIKGTSAIILTHFTRSVALTFTNSLCMNISSCIIAEMHRNSEGTKSNRMSVHLANSRVLGSSNSMPKLDKASGIHAISYDYRSESIIFDLFLNNVTFTNNFIGPKGVVYVNLDNADCTVQLVDILFQDNSVASPITYIIAFYNSYKVNMSLQTVKFSSSSTAERAIMLDVRKSIITNIASCDFTGYAKQQIDGGLIHMKSNLTCDLHIENSNFINNRGCIYLRSPTCTVDFKSSRFLQNTGLSIGILWGLFDVLYAKIRNCYFDSNQVADSGSSLFVFFSQAVNLTVLNSEFMGPAQSRLFSIGYGSTTGNTVVANIIFRNIAARSINTAYAGSGIAVHAQSGSLKIDDCVFNDILSGTTGGVIYAEFEVSLLVDIKKSIFARTSAVRGSGGALYLTGVYTLSLDEVTIDGGITYRGEGAGLYLESANDAMMTAYINRCTFTYCGSSSAVYITTVKSSSADISVINSIFLSNEDVSSSGGECMYLLLNEGQSQVQFKNVTFESCTAYQGSAGALMVESKGSSLVTFDSCTFLNNAAPQGNGGAIMIQFPKDTITDPGCAEDSSSDSHKEWSYTSKTKFKNTVFKNNTSLDAGALALSRGQHNFSDCLFVNNFAKLQGGHIMSYEDSTSILIVNTKFLQTERQNILLDVIERRCSLLTVTSFIVTQSQGPLILKNSSLESKPLGDVKPLVMVSKGGYVSFDNNTSLICPRGSDLEILNFTTIVNTEYKSHPCKISLSVLQFNCKACPIESYSLQHGRSVSLKKIGGFQCFPCPFGAKCLKTVAAKENYWGYQVPRQNPPALNFTNCPAGYCKHPDKGDPLRYNSCHGNRSGILCGQCKTNYTETLLSPSCRRNDECDDTWLWGVAVVMLLVMATYLVHKPRLGVFFTREIFWYRNDIMVEEVPGHGDARVERHDNGYLKIVFYFYQVANLLLISTSYNTIIESHLLQPVVGFFNFQFRFSSSGFLCPFPGLTVVTKELLLASQVFGVFFVILFCYFCHVFFRRCRSLPSPNLGPYFGAVLETMLLGYAVFANTAFRLLRCTTIGDESRLFISGQVLCYQWWQYLLMVFVGVVVVHFVLILGLGSYWLSKGSISVKGFLLGCALPLPYLVYRLASHLLRQQRQPSEESAEWKTCIEDVLFGAFRPREGDSYGALYWESVLTGRRLLIIIIYVSFSDPLCKHLLLTFVCVAILLHHTIVRPFRNTKANNIEIVSLLGLVAIAIINTFKASFLTSGQYPQGPLQSSGQILDWTQIIILSVVPMICILLVTVCVVSQLVRLCTVMGRFVCANCCGRYFAQESRPLVEPY